MTYYMGVDLGTSSIKLLLVKNTGEIVGSSSSSFSLISVKENYSEQSPNDWIEGFNKSFRSLLEKFPAAKEKLKAISFSGQMHSLVLLNSEGVPLRNAILWNDTRTTEQVELLKKNDLSHLLQVEKNIPLEGFTLPKILWIKKFDRKKWEKTWKWMMPKDYLIYHLTGRVCTDRSDASGTILYDINNFKWDEVLLKKYDIEKEQCPEILKSTDIAGVMKKTIQKSFNLKHQIKIVMGGGDNACGALGTINDKNHQGMISVGTSGVVLCYSNTVDKSVGNYHYFNSLVENQNYKMGVTLSAAYSLEWYRKNFSSNESFEELTQSAMSSPIGSKELLFLPYLFGERSPYYNSALSAGFLGIKSVHRKGDFVRSVMEGVAFSLRNVYESMQLVASDQKNIFRITGGITKNSLWLQIFADIFNARIEVLSVEEGPALGASICAIKAVEEVDEDQIWHRLNQVATIFKPDKKNVELYNHYYNQFKLISDRFDDCSINE